MKWRDLGLTLGLLLILAPYLNAQTAPINAGFSGGAIGAALGLPDGNQCVAPALFGKSRTTTGLYFTTDPALGLCANGTEQVRVSSTVNGGLVIKPTGWINWGATGLGDTDLGLVRQGAGTMSLTNGTATGKAAFQTGGGNTLALPAGSIGLATSATSSAGNTGQGARLVVVCGPTAGTASLLFYAGTTNTPVVLANAVGGGLIGC